MEYFLFTYPNCSQCQQLKEAMNAASLEVEEHNLVLKESKMRIREFLPHIKRDEKGAVIIPSLVLQEGGNVEAVLNSSKELEDWLKSKA